MPDDERLLDTEAVSARTGLSVPTIRVYLKRSRAAVAANQGLRQQDFPLPDRVIGRSPAWRESTIDAWLAARPGSGRRDTASDRRAVPPKLTPDDVADAWGITEPKDRAMLRAMFEALRQPPSDAG